jgi:hypothetical protein
VAIGAFLLSDEQSSSALDIRAESLATLPAEAEEGKQAVLVN